MKIADRCAGGITVMILALAATLSGCTPDVGTPVATALPPQGIPFDAAPPPAGEPPVPSPDDSAAVDVASVPAISDPLALPPDRIEEPVAGESVPPEKTASGDDDLRAISFAELASFEYFAEDPLAPMTRRSQDTQTEIPKSIQALAGERVKVDGYLMPTIFQSGRVKQFLLTRSYITCCFGDVLNMNEVIDVTVPDKLEISYFLSGQPITLTGRLEVGEKKSEFGYVESIYRIDAEGVEERW